MEQADQPSNIPIFFEPPDGLRDAFFDRPLPEVYLCSGLGAIPPGIMAAHPGPGGAGDRRLAGDPGEHLIALT